VRKRIKNTAFQRLFHALLEFRQGDKLLVNIRNVPRGTKTPSQKNFFYNGKTIAFLLKIPNKGSVLRAVILIT
jgi:hypothetical protein